jgi:hypothetical protein
LKALKAVRTTSPLLRQCQEALNDISARHMVGLFWVPGHAGVCGNEIADGLARSGSALRFLRPEPHLGVSRCDIRRKLGYGLSRQHRANWYDPANTFRQARELIAGPCLGTRVKFLSFNRIQSRAVTGLLTGHNTLRRHLQLMGLLDSPLCRKCGVKEETSAHILCECEALAALRRRHLGSLFLEPEDIKSLSLGAIWCNPHYTNKVTIKITRRFVMNCNSQSAEPTIPLVVTFTRGRNPVLPSLGYYSQE